MVSDCNGRLASSVGVIYAEIERGLVNHEFDDRQIRHSLRYIHDASLLLCEYCWS